MKKIKLGDVCKIITGPFGSQLHASDYVEEGIAWVMPINIGDRLISTDSIAKISLKDVERLKRYKLELGDIIYSRRGDIEKCALVRKENVGFLCGTGCLRIRVDKNSISPDFLSFYLGQNYIKKWIVDNSVGATMPNLNSDILAHLPLNLPKLKIQNKIAAVLSSLDEKISLNKKINATLEDMAKTLYDYFFVQFDFPDENGKPYKSSGGKMIFNAELNREIPVGWKVESLKNKISITRGISYDSDNISDDALGMPMINLASIDRKRNYIPEGVKFFKGELPDDKKLKAMDMLVACTDVTRQAKILGSPILVMNDREYTFSMDLAKISICDERIKKLYLYMTLRTNFYHQYIAGFASGTTVLHLDLSGMDWYMIAIPPLDLQLKFSTIMEHIYLQTCCNIRESQNLTELRDFLLPMLMNGQVGFKG